MPNFKGEIGGHSLPFKVNEPASPSLSLSHLHTNTPSCGLLTCPWTQDTVDAGEVVGVLFEAKDNKKKRKGSPKASPKKSPKKTPGKK